MLLSASASQDNGIFYFSCKRPSSVTGNSFSRAKHPWLLRDFFFLVQNTLDCYGNFFFSCKTPLSVTGNFFSRAKHPWVLREIFFLVQNTLEWNECESTWVTIDLIDIEIQRLQRIKSGLRRNLRKAKAAIFCKLCFFCYICNAFSHAAHGLCLRDGRKQPHNEQKFQFK